MNLEPRSHITEVELFFLYGERYDIKLCNAGMESITILIDFSTKYRSNLMEKIPLY